MLTPSPTRPMPQDRGFGPFPVHEQHAEWLRQQYLRNLETLDRIERQLEDRQGLDFFGAMGELHAAQEGRGT